MAAVSDVPGTPQGRSEVVTQGPAAAAEPPTPSGVASSAPKEPSPERDGWRLGRAVLSVILAVLGVLSLTIAPLAIWGRNLVLNTDRYVDTLAPLAADPAVQSALIAAVNRRVEDHLDVAPFVDGLLPPNVAKALEAPLQSAVYRVVDIVTSRVVRSHAFQVLWNEMNRVAHKQLVAIVTGKKLAHGLIEAKSGKLLLNLSPVVEQVRDRLVSAGIDVAKRIPAAGATIEIARLSGLTRAQREVRTLNTLANWLPLIGVVLVAAAVALARRRRRALVACALGVGGGMILLALGLAIGRSIYLSRLATTAFPRDAATSAYSILVRYLRLGIGLVFAVMLLLALVTWVTGSSPRAVVVRHVVSNMLQKLGRREHAGRVGAFAGRYASWIRITILAVAGILLFTIDGWSVGGLIALAVVTVVLLVGLEILRAPVAERSSPT